MAEKPANDDAAYVDELMARLPTTAVPQSLEARILGDFDRTHPARASRPGWMQRLHDHIWPGAPVWKPVSLLALSLAVGLVAGAFVPAASLSPAATTEQMLSATDTTSALDLYKDL